MFLGVTEEKAHFFGSKTADQRFGDMQKNSVLLKFAAKLLLFKVFCSKNAENDYFDQRLECAAPKRWSKYTTDVFDYS